MKSMKSLGLMLLGFGMSVNAMAQTELANWTFETGYDVADGVYTPNESEWTAVGAQWFNAGAPSFLPNSAAGNAADYMVTASTARYWELCSGWDNHVFRVVNDTESNNITDYTDAAQHANYYEVQFPAKGYTNIKMTLANAYGGNAEATLQSVISTDGGATWTVGETATTAGTWWTYNPNTLSIPATDCEKVIVRLIFGNGFSSNWNMDYITLTGEEFTGDVSNMMSLTTKVNPAGAGTVLASPMSDRYEQGTEITLTQTTNIGYTFLNWTDAAGNVLGTDASYQFSITENTSITANYEEVEIINSIPNDEANVFNMRYGELHGSRASFGSDNHIDWMNNGDYAIYKLKNTIDAQYYDIDFGVGTQQDNVSITFALANEAGETVWSGTQDIENNHNWGEYKHYSLRTSALAKGKYTMTITLNSVGGNGTTGNLNNIKFTGKAAFVPETVENQTATITYAFDQGVDGQTGVYSAESEGWFKSNYTEYGATLAINGVSLNQTKFQPSISNEGSANEENQINFYIIPKNGLTFTPTKVSFNTTRYGTNGGLVDASWVNSDGTTVSIETGIVPARNNDVTAFSKEVSGAAASSGVCGLRLNLYKLGDNKQVGFGNIVIEGIVNGTTEDVAQYTLNVGIESDAAGEVTVKPNAPTFAEGDEVTLIATENFGYHFAAWVNAEGETVSTENPYTFAISANTDLKATYTQKNVYALNLKVIDDMENTYGNANLVTIVPDGNIINGVHHYEEGTDVKLTVNNNKILSFTGWEDKSTNAERIINMDGEKNLTVNYAVADYIVAWDLYQDQPGSERAADYKSNPENAGLLSLRKADGTTAGWLTRGVNNGAEEGRWGARIWKLRSEGWYWEISFSTKGYSNITFSNGFGHSYNTYAVMKAEYSVDGTNFTEVGTYDIPTRGWVDGEFTLPAEANNQNRVWIRWMPGSEELVGNETDYDGLSIGDIFVMGESEQANDQAAPVLVGSNPENNATGASATGSIVLTFNERIKAGTGTATLNGEAIAPNVNGKTAVFQYSGLDYNTAYSFTLPAGVITDRSGNAYEGITLNFTTMERTQPVARLYDAVVAADGSGDYLTVQEAIDAAPEGRAIPWLIFIKNGEYKGHVDVPKNKPYLHFIGQERDKVIITDDKLCGGDNAVHVSVGATVVVNSNDCYFDNLTLENSWGHDKQAGPQALALNTTGDRTVFKNVAMLSYQDTWITPSTSNYRAYVKDCFIEGAVDFIYNSGNIYIDNTTLYINRKSGGYIVAPSHGADVEWGYVFMNCRITAPGVPSETDVWLGRPWHNSPKTVFINTIAEVTIPAKGWYPTMGGLPVLWADYNTMDGNGNPVDLSQREDTYYYTNSDGSKTYGTAKNYLTAEEAAQYTVKNVLSGKDNWQPAIITESCAAPVATWNDDKSTLSWEAVPYAICYVIVKNGKDIEFTTETTISAEAGATYMVYAANEQGGLSAGCDPNATGIQSAVAAEAQIVAIHTVNGVQLKALQPGLNIVTMQDAQGNIIVRKVMK